MRHPAPRLPLTKWLQESNQEIDRGSLLCCCGMVILLIISLLLLWLLLVSAALTEDDSGFVVTNDSFSGVANSLGASGQQQPSPCCRCSLSFLLMERAMMMSRVMATKKNGRYQGNTHGWVTVRFVVDSTSKSSLMAAMHLWLVSRENTR